MHPNPVFRTQATPQDIDLLRTRAFGTLALNGVRHPLTAHIPFRLNAEATELELHLVRSNPIVPVVKTTSPAVLTCLGSDGYVSPDWYEVDDQVPTWNYVAVRVTGTLERLRQEELRGVLDRLSTHLEDQLPKPNWTTEKMTPNALERMMRMIVPFRMTDLQIDGTWKLNQNKEDNVRLDAAGQIAGSVGSELETLAELMKSTNRQDTP